MTTSNVAWKIVTARPIVSELLAGAGVAYALNIQESIPQAVVAYCLPGVYAGYQLLTHRRALIREGLRLYKVLQTPLDAVSECKSVNHPCPKCDLDH